MSPPGNNSKVSAADVSNFDPYSPNYKPVLSSNESKCEQKNEPVQIVVSNNNPENKADDSMRADRSHKDAPEKIPDNKNRDGYGLGLEQDHQVRGAPAKIDGSLNHAAASPAGNNLGNEGLHVNLIAAGGNASHLEAKDNAQVTEEDPLNCHQNLIRWWYRKSNLQSALLYRAFEPRRWLEGPNIPLHENESTAGKCIVYFAEGWNFITRTLYPMTIGALLSHDIYVHFSEKALRYGTDIWEILLGARYSSAPDFFQSMGLNEQTYTSAWGSDLPFGGNQSPFIYWIMPVSVLAAAFLVGSSCSIGGPSSKTRNDIAEGLRDLNHNQFPDDFSLHQDNKPVQQPEDPQYKILLNDCFSWISSVYRNVGRAEHLVLWDGNTKDEERNDFLNGIGNVAKKRYLWLRFRAIRALAKIADGYFVSDLNKSRLSKEERTELIKLKYKAIEMLKEVAGLFLENKPERFFPLTPGALYARYQLWTIQRLTTNSHSDTVLNLLLIPQFILGSLYFAYRYYLMPTQKIVGFSLEMAAKKACEQRGLRYIYDTRSGQNDCVVRDWPFANYRQMRSAQGCMDALLAVPRTREFILSHLRDLIQDNSFNPEIVITDIDLSKNITDWQDGTWKQFFQKLKAGVKKLDSLNLAFPSITRIAALSEDRVNTLVDFLLSVPVKKLVLDNLYLGSANMQRIISALHNTTEYLSFSGCNMDDDAMNYLNEALGKLPQLKVVKLAQNNFSDESSVRFGQKLNQTVIDTTDVSLNNLNLGLNAILESAESGSLKNVVMSGIRLTLQNAKALGKAMVYLQTVEVDQCELGDSHLVEMKPYNATTTRFTARGNHIGGQGCIKFIEDLPAGIGITIDFAKNRLNDQDMPLLGDVLKDKVFGLLLDKNEITPIGFAKLMEYVPQTSLQELSVAEVQSLGKAAVPILAKSLQKNPGKLKAITVSGLGLEPAQGELLLDLPNYSQVKEIKAANNNLDCGAVKQPLPVQVVKLDLGSNRFNGTCISLLTQNVTGSQLDYLGFENNMIPDEDIFDFTKRLVKETTGNLDPKHFDELGEVEIGTDLPRALHWPTTQSATKLTEVDFRGNSAGIKSQRAIDRISHIVPGIQTDELQTSAAVRKAEPIFIFRWLGMLNLQDLSAGIRTNLIKGVKGSVGLLAAGGGFFAASPSHSVNSFALSTNIVSHNNTRMESSFNPSTLLAMFFMLVVVGFYYRLYRSNTAEIFLERNVDQLAGDTGIGLYKKRDNQSKKVELPVNSQQQNAEEKVTTPRNSQ